MSAAHPDNTIELGCQAETRVGHKGRRTHGWAPTGSRPPVPIDPRYDHADVLGACCPTRDCADGLIVPRAATVMMQWHLDEISAQLPAQVYAAIIITDGASWPRAPTLTTPQHITLIPAPPYSPRCNPAEKPWQ